LKQRSIIPAFNKIMESTEPLETHSKYIFDYVLKA